MSLRVIELIARNNIVVYTFPAHTSGTIHPCAVQIFIIFNLRLRYVIGKPSDLLDIEQFEQFEF